MKTKTIHAGRIIIRSYLFDLDNTLIDTTIYGLIYTPILAMIQQKKKMSLAKIQKKAIELKVKKNPAGRYDTGDLCKKLDLLSDYYRILRQHLNKNRMLKKHVLNTFKKLTQEGKTIGIVSNSMRKTIELYIKMYNLTKYIDFIYTAEDAKLQKSHPFFWKKLCKKQNLKPSSCIVVGDDPQNDFMLPERLGFHTFLIMQEKDLLKIR